MNFDDCGEAEAERIEERRAEDSPGRGRAVEDRLRVVDIREAGIRAAGIRAVDILPFRSPPADNLRMRIRMRMRKKESENE